MKTVISNSLTGVIFFFLWLLAMTLSGGRAQAQESGFGLGIILGEPTGLTAKKWLSTDTALDFAAAWSFGGEDSITLHADFLQHKFNLIKIESGSLPVYYGIGGRLKFDKNDTRLAARIPIGLNYHFEGAVLDIFVEVVPRLELVPSTEFDIGAALGVRYFFK